MTIQLSLSVGISEPKLMFYEIRNRKITIHTGAFNEKLNFPYIFHHKKSGEKVSQLEGCRFRIV